ncbi:MAG: protein-L-isoaspartate(D-aspartate) O-methyltransferase [Spirochaetia bacterium]
MVEEQIKGRDVSDPRVLEAMRSTPRHLFVPENRRNQAYQDRPLPIGHGQTISQPYIVAFMTETLQLEEGDKVLEIGTGSGYQAAVLAELTREVYSIEIIDGLAERGEKALREAGYDYVQVKKGDGYYGWESHAPFDAVIVTAAAGHIPPPLIEQLKKGGRMVIPVGGVYQTQVLMLVKKDMEGEISTERLMTVRFVPMTGEAQE